MYYMHTHSPSFSMSPRNFLGALRLPSSMSGLGATRTSAGLDLTRVSAERMEEIADAWRNRALEGDLAADRVADVLESVARERREKASHSRLQAIRLGLASLTNY